MIDKKTTDGITTNQYNEFCKIIKNLLNLRAKKYIKTHEVKQFLSDNPFPETEKNKIPGIERVYYLLINRLKNWVSREQRKKDSCSNWKKNFKKNPAGKCIICGGDFHIGGEDNIEFHHIIRDGRHPIPVHKKCHRNRQDLIKTIQAIQTNPTERR